MKKLTDLVSPFIMLLIPVFLIIALLIINQNLEIPAEKLKASASFQIPSFKVLVYSVF
jgi:hypothetical protein